MMNIQSQSFSPSSLMMWRVFWLWFGSFSILFLQRNFIGSVWASALAYGIWGVWILSFCAQIFTYLRTAKRERRLEPNIQIYLLYEYLFFIVALSLYFAFIQEDAWFSKLIFGKGLLLSDVLFVISIVFAFFYSVGLEFSYWKELKSPKLNWESIKTTIRIACRLALVLSVLIFFNMASVFWNFSWDGSYLKATSPSSSTVEILQKVIPKLKIKAFFSKDNEIRNFVAAYCSGLEARLREIQCEFIDKDERPDFAEEYQVARDGQFVFAHDDGRRERIDFGTNLQAARQEVRNIDLLFQKVALSLVGKKKRIYFTKGHGELSWGGLNIDPLLSLNILEKFLREQNYEVAWLSKTDGNGSNEVPSDADLLVTIGADLYFVESEIKAIQDYLMRGGAYILWLDHPKKNAESVKTSKGVGEPFNRWLHDIGIDVLDGVLSNDRQYIKISGTLSDRWWVVSNVFMEHPITETLRRQQERNSIIFAQALALKLKEVKNNPWVLRDIVRGSSDSYLDLNKNFKLDAPPETLDAQTLVALATRDIDSTNAIISNQARLLVYSDASLLSDALIRNNGNINIIANTFRWMLRNDFSLGEIQSNEDVRILHTHKEDLLYFYFSIFGVPLIIMLVGFIALRKEAKN